MEDGREHPECRGPAASKRHSVLVQEKEAADEAERQQPAKGRLVLQLPGPCLLAQQPHVKSGEQGARDGYYWGKHDGALYRATVELASG